MKRSFVLPSLLAALFISCSQPDYDTIIRNGMVYDGSGADPVATDVAINADTIAFIGDLSEKTAKEEFDAKGLAVSPGFINMLSWANTSLIEDGRSQSDIRQGVTLEVMGEGNSMGPLNEAMKEDKLANQSDIKYDINWTTLGEYLEMLEQKGISTNIASFIGNATVRKHVLGNDSRKPTPEELATMKDLVKQAMEEGAMGISSSLIYVPSIYSDTDELIELAKVVAEYDGMYISHMRSESAKLLEAVQELITISRKAGLWAEIYHLKASETANWGKLDSVISLVEAAREEGLHITADMYTYPASSTGLNIVLPQWAKDGGHDSTMARFQDPELRAKAIAEVRFTCTPDSTILVGFKNPDLRKYTGLSVGEIARERGISPEQAVVDLIEEDDSRIGTVYFTMSENNIKKKIAIPWVSFCSDAGSYTNEGVFLKRSTHPRAYGSFIRVLGKYSRDEKVIPLTEAIHKLSFLPATNLKLKKRGLLASGYYADVVVFDPNTVTDNATFAEPHQYATGVNDVWVNGMRVLNNGEHTGAHAGRVVRGPGYKE
jgi:N-acyl-D-aspartate/D-glutamate deacylase